MARKRKQNKLKQCTLYVDGMHCASCEVLIEKKLLNQSGIEAVDASLKGSRVEITYQGENRPDVERLNKDFKEVGYNFSHKKTKKKEKPALMIKNGRLVLNPKKVGNLFKIFFAIVSLFIAFWIFEKLQLGQYVSVDASSSLPAFFLLGVVAGLSSCAALVGGLLLSMVKQWNELYIASTSKMEKAQPHVMFHLGRVLSFALFGGLLGLVGERISFQNTTFFAIVTALVSVVMVVLALQMLGVEWAQKLKFTAPKSFTRFAADEQNFQGKYMPFAIGALTFLLPCGFTLVAQTIALTSGSFVQGALVMLFFSLGTLPTLLGISYSGIALNSKPHLTARFNIVAGFVIFFFALYNINGQMNVLGAPSLSDISFSSSSNAAEIAEVNEAGEQIISLTAQGFEYIPTGPTSVQAGIPTTLVVNNQGIQGCGAYIAARGMINGYVELRPGINNIPLGKLRAGTYKLTCSMGMVAPVTISVIET